jgi:hypothetical protein
VKESEVVKKGDGACHDEMKKEKEKKEIEEEKNDKKKQNVEGISRG